ncbi:MAG: metal-dependent hydrolase [Thermoplasmata archaeon]|nr:metal-dependent hydrolase [Thermoplasmata archaeon]
MDPFTHYMIGFALGKKMGLDIPGKKCMVLFSLLPDIDTLTILLGYDFASSFHGTVTHSLLFAILTAGTVETVYFVKHRQHLFPVVFAAISLHILLDIPQTSFMSSNLNPFYPFHPIPPQRLFPVGRTVGMAVVLALFLTALWTFLKNWKDDEGPIGLWRREKKEEESRG